MKEKIRVSDVIWSVIILLLLYVTAGFPVVWTLVDLEGFSFIGAAIAYHFVLFLAFIVGACFWIGLSE